MPKEIKKKNDGRLILSPNLFRISYVFLAHNLITKIRLLYVLAVDVIPLSSQVHIVSFACIII